MKKVITFVLKHCGEIGAVVAGLSLVVMIVFLAFDNVFAAGVSFCIGIFIGMPFRCASALELDESILEDKIKEREEE